MGHLLSRICGDEDDTSESGGVQARGNSYDILPDTPNTRPQSSEDFVVEVDCNCDTDSDDDYSAVAHHDYYGKRPLRRDSGADSSHSEPLRPSKRMLDYGGTKNRAVSDSRTQI